MKRLELKDLQRASGGVGPIVFGIAALLTTKQATTALASVALIGSVMGIAADALESDLESE